MAQQDTQLKDQGRPEGHWGHKDSSEKTSQRSRDGDIPSRAAAEQGQAEEALKQMGAHSHRQINEAGRTNDSAHRDNPEGSVGAVPTPSIRGTWR